MHYISIILVLLGCFTTYRLMKSMKPDSAILKLSNKVMAYFKTEQQKKMAIIVLPIIWSVLAFIFFSTVVLVPGFIKSYIIGLVWSFTLVAYIKGKDNSI